MALALSGSNKMTVRSLAVPKRALKPNGVPSWPAWKSLIRSRHQTLAIQRRRLTSLTAHEKAKSTIYLPPQGAWATRWIVFWSMAKVVSLVVMLDSIRR